MTGRIPVLAGVAEVAALAGVSRSARVSSPSIRSSPPRFSVLAMGPVWLEADVKTFLATPRPPGRPRKRRQVTHAPAPEAAS